jgi:triacylglycerol lipase
MRCRETIVATCFLAAAAGACALEPAGPMTKADVAAAAADGKADLSLDLCELNGWYGDEVCDWFCLRHDSDCDVPPIGPEPSGSPTRFPILLAHGFHASPTNEWAFFGVAEALAADGHRVFVSTVPPHQSLATRSDALAEEIAGALAESGAERIHVIAHSMGGLDARRVASPAGLGLGAQIASVTTIGTAHRGTVVADIALGLLPGFADGAINAIASAWGATFSTVAEDSDVRGALESLAVANAAAFAAANPDDARVVYQSWAGVTTLLGLGDAGAAAACDGRSLIQPGTADRVDPRLIPTALLVGAHGEPHDGLVTVASAKHGAFRGCVPADHLDLIGQVSDTGVDPDTGFDHVRFYRNLAYDLASRGL